MCGTAWLTTRSRGNFSVTSQRSGYERDCSAQSTGGRTVVSAADETGIEQVRKRGLPPPLLGLDERGQAPLPDLFYPSNSCLRLFTYGGRATPLSVMIAVMN